MTTSLGNGNPSRPVCHQKPSMHGSLRGTVGVPVYHREMGRNPDGLGRCCSDKLKKAGGGILHKNRNKEPVIPHQPASIGKTWVKEVRRSGYKYRSPVLFTCIGAIMQATVAHERSRNLISRPQSLSPDTQHYPTDIGYESVHQNMF